MASSSHFLDTDQVETDAVIATKNQLCNRCNKTVLESRQTPQYLSGQGILCSNCEQTQGFTHPAHKCYLFLVNLINMMWKCNGCNKSVKDLKDTKCYHCNICEFYLCVSCYEPKKYLVHEHYLTKTDVTSIYVRSCGNWQCDCCGGNNGRNNFLPRHCDKCEFDLCETCCNPQRSSLHLHDLYRANTELVYSKFHGGWRCDCCSNRFHPNINKFSNHCPICEFDLCDVCMKKTDGTDKSRAPVYVTKAGRPLAQPEEDLARLALNNPSRNTNDEAMCIICLTNPKNATIIHGITGHVCCCLDCAKTLERRGDPCPICRHPIQSVIRQLNY